MPSSVAGSGEFSVNRFERAGSTCCDWRPAQFAHPRVAAGPNLRQVAGKRRPSARRRPWPFIWRLDPVVGQPVEVGPGGAARSRTAAPARGRPSDRCRSTRSGRSPRQQRQPWSPFWRFGPSAKQRPGELHGLVHVDAVELAARGTQPPLAPEATRPRRHQAVVGLRHQVDRRAHERRLDDLARLERLRQRPPPELAEARPQADVTGWRVLVLDAADYLEGGWDRERLAFEEALSGEQSSVEMALG